jgi:hypothetical protein
MTWLKANSTQHARGRGIISGRNLASIIPHETAIVSEIFHAKDCGLDVEVLGTWALLPGPRLEKSYSDFASDYRPPPQVSETQKPKILLFHPAIRIPRR